jgi:hypothetical protein
MALTAAAAGAVAVAVVVSMAGGAQTRLATASPSRFQSLLKTQLTRRGLDYRWVVCIPSGRSFHGARIVRCNVDFGEPHIEAYCSVLRGGQLLTSQEDPAIPCGHDNSGMYTPVVTYN